MCRDAPVARSGVVPGQCRDGLSPADRRAGAVRRRIPAVRGAAHARASHRRPGRRAARHRREHRLPGHGRLSAAGDPSRCPLARAAGAGARRRVLAVPHGVADGPATFGARCGDRSAGRADLQAVCRDHAQPDEALRHRCRARRLARVPGAREILFKPGRNPCRGRRLLGLVFPRGWRDFRRARAGGGRGAGQHPGRRALRGGARAHGRAGDPGPQLDRGPRFRKTARARRRPEPHPGRGNDGRGDGAVRRRPEHVAQHRQLAREGNRSPRRHGDRTAQARRDRGGGRGLPARGPAGETAAGHRRHL